MKFSENWLREWISPDISSDELVSQLTMLGLEVDSVEKCGASLEGVVVGHVTQVEPHPDADRLRVCQVSAGEQTYQVVCGAPNVHSGMRTAFATIGANLPSGMKIKSAKLRGVESSGMLCSEAELGLSDSSSGLIALDPKAPAGMSIREFMQLDDTIIEVDITPNRSDCFCIRGVARDVSARNNIGLTKILHSEVDVISSDNLSVKVEANNGCVNYTGRVIKGVDNSVKTPLWMVERLRRSGVRSISPVVDVTNYVMFEIGQPMHGFDMAKLQGGIVVRYAAAEEKLVLLDGREVTLTNDTTVIADDRGAIGIAGIMGGDSTGCDDTTTDVFLESALFLPEHIAGKSRGYSVHTESGHRFERGVDPSLQEEALDYATQLILDMCGGQAGPITVSTESARMPFGAPIKLRRERIKRILGIEVADSDLSDLLGKLGVDLSEEADGWSAAVPSYRYDMRIEADLIEEIARVYGYDNLPRTYPDLAPGFSSVKDQTSDMDSVRQKLIEDGYQEVITYSFVDCQIQELILPDVEALPLANPISSDLAQMRTSLWPGLIATLKKNLNRQLLDVRIFEMGLRFVVTDGVLQQDRMFAGLLSGRASVENWFGDDRVVDFFDLKGDLEVLFKKAHLEQVEFVAAENPALHPGQSAKLLYNGDFAGWIGVLHPNLQKSLDLSQTAIVFEIKQELLETSHLPSFQEISKFPAVRRDIAIVLKDDIPMSSIESTVLQSAPKYLQKLVVFDVYRGDKVASGLKSVALGLILQDNSRTLDESKVESSVASIIKVLEEKSGATLRM